MTAKLSVSRKAGPFAPGGQEQRRLALRGRPPPAIGTTPARAHSEKLRRIDAVVEIGGDIDLDAPGKPGRQPFWRR